MPRKSSLYGPRTNKEIARQVKNFNARRLYEIRKEPESAEWAPAKASAKAIKAEAKTRADLNMILRDLAAFNSETAKPVQVKDGKVSAWELQVTAKSIEKSNQRRARRLKEINPNTKTGTMGAAEQHNLRPIAFEPEKMTVKEIKYKQKIARSERKKNFRAERDQLYKDTYLQTVRDNLGEYADKVIALIGDLDPATMLKGYAEDPVLNIKFVSDPLKISRIAAEVLQHWRDYLGIETTLEDYDEKWDEELQVLADV